MTIEARRTEPSPRTAYFAFLDGFVDAVDLRDHLDTLVDRLRRQGKSGDAIWAALGLGADVWQRERIWQSTVIGIREPMERERRQAARGLKTFVGWLRRECGDPETRRRYADMVRGLRTEFHAQTLRLEGTPHRRRAGRNWAAWNAAREVLVAAGITSEADLSELRVASALDRKPPF